MSFWTEQDVLLYIKQKQIKIADVYGELKYDANCRLYTTGLDRTGCVFCLFGINQDKTPNRIQRLAKTHPKLYDYCLNQLGLKKVMEYIGKPYEPEAEVIECPLANVKQ
jgi:3'-phosphoadenosine 5'-phosphosulfate sulfotransferase (PAPS reductase)/FAD synthetase